MILGWESNGKSVGPHFFCLPGRGGTSGFQGVTILKQRGEFVQGLGIQKILKSNCTFTLCLRAGNWRWPGCPRESEQGIVYSPHCVEILCKFVGIG